MVFNKINLKKVNYKIILLLKNKKNILSQNIVLNFNLKKILCMLDYLTSFNFNYKIFFVNNIKIFYFYFYILKKIYLKFFFLFCNFCYSKIFLKVGLGFKKKTLAHKKMFAMALGRRKWVVFITQPISFFFSIKRKNVFMFCNSKSKLNYYLTHLKYMRKGSSYKYKGIFSMLRIKISKRLCKSMLFARRIKFKRIRLKLTKKQKQKK